MNKIQILKRRLKKLNIHIDLNGNYPHIYLTHINDYPVREKRLSEHGWVIGYMPTGDKPMVIVGVSDLFNLIREYTSESEGTRSYGLGGYTH